MYIYYKSFSPICNKISKLGFGVLDVHDDIELIETTDIGTFGV